MSKSKNELIKIIVPTHLYEKIRDQAESIIRKGILTLKIQCLEREVQSLEERIAYLKKRLEELPDDVKREERMLNELIEDQKKLETFLSRKGMISFG
ncbi:MAG: hypothetical protein ACP5IM_01840 [Candidatus Bathyarchaeia archaeon]